MNHSSYRDLRLQLSDALAAAIGAAGYAVPERDHILNSIDLSKGGFGDLSCSISFRIAKASGRDTNQIALAITAKLRKPELIERISVEKGFINFYIDRKGFTLSVLSPENKGRAPIKKKVILEYPSKNPNSPWHLGSLRNPLLGDSLARIYEAAGYIVEREDYIDDLGLQMVESLWGYLNLDNKPDKKFDHWLGAQYVRVNEYMKDHDLKGQLAQLLLLMEQDGTEESLLSRNMAAECVRAHCQTAFSYQIYHDVMVWESDILRSRLFDKAMKKLDETGVTKKETSGKYKDCIIIDLSSLGDLPKELAGQEESIKVLIRSDGTPTYVAKDIAFHMWKLGLLDPGFKYKEFLTQPNNKPLFTTSPEKGKPMNFGAGDIAINIIDSRQYFPQMMLKLAFAAMGRKDIADRIIHFSYGVVEAEGSSLSARRGTQGHTADELLQEATIKAHSLISERSELSREEREAVAKSVAISAIKFEFLKISPEKKILFSWKNALNFEGNSGPYCQYMHARASRILEGADIKGINLTDKEAPAIASDSEFELVRLLSRSDYILDKALSELRPSTIADYLNELSSCFARFYELNPILKADDERQRRGRLLITGAFKETTAKHLLLLGITPLDRM